MIPCALCHPHAQLVAWPTVPLYQSTKLPMYQCITLSLYHSTTETFDYALPGGEGVVQSPGAVRGPRREPCTAAFRCGRGRRHCS